MTEHDIQNKIRIALGSKGIYTERMNSGSFWHGEIINNDGKMLVLKNPRKIQGCVAGTSDIIGLVPVKISQKMVGSTIGVLLALEIKKPGMKPRGDQQRYIDMINCKGGIAGYATSIEDAEKIINKFNVD